MEISSLSSSSGDAAATTVPSYPAWVLLEKNGYLADRDEATSANCNTITGHNVKVTFCILPPPSVSYFCVHLSKSEDDDTDIVEPFLIFSAKDLILFRFYIGRATSTDEDFVQYFVYKAGRGRPSLTPILSTPPGNTDSSCVSIVPCDDEQESYILADLSVGSEPGHYNLHIYSSKTCNWNTTLLQLPTSAFRVREDLPSQFHKVIGLGGDEVGWVDLWRGIITCKVFDTDLHLRLIPLPKPEVNMPLEGEPGLTLDVTYCNGLFKFVEMDHFCRPVIVVSDTIHDSELTHDKMAEEPILVPDGWKIRTCYRSGSWDFWLKAHIVHVDDISVDGPIYSMFLQMLDACDQELALRNLSTFCPTFSIHGGNVVYLISKVKFDDDNTWIVGVDLGEKMVKLIQPYSTLGYGYIRPALLPSTFSYYLNTTPGYLSATSTSHSEDATKKSTVRSSAGEDTSAPSGDWNFGENNLSPSHEYANGQLTNLLQSLHSISMSSVSGYVHQTMKPVLNTDADGKLWLSLPLDDLFSQLEDFYPF